MLKKWMQRSPSKGKTDLDIQRIGDGTNDVKLISALKSYICNMGGDATQLNGWRVVRKKNRDGSFSSDFSYVSTNGLIFRGKLAVAKHFDLVQEASNAKKDKSSTTLLLQHFNEDNDDDSDDDDDDAFEGFEAMTESQSIYGSSSCSSPSFWSRMAQDESESYLRTASIDNHRQSYGSSIDTSVLIVDEDDVSAAEHGQCISPSPYSPLHKNKQISKVSVSSLTTPKRQSLSLPETPTTPPTPLHIPAQKSMMHTSQNQDDVLDSTQSSNAVVALSSSIDASGDITVHMNTVDMCKDSIDSTIDVYESHTESTHDTLDDDDDAFDFFEEIDSISPDILGQAPSQLYEDVSSLGQKYNQNDIDSDDDFSFFEPCASSPSIKIGSISLDKKDNVVGTKTQKLTRKRKVSSSQNKSLKNTLPSSPSLIKFSLDTDEVVNTDSVNSGLMMVVSEKERNSITNQRMKLKTRSTLRRQTVKVNQSEMIEKIAWLQEKVLPALVDIISIESMIDDQNHSSDLLLSNKTPNISDDTLSKSVCLNQNSGAGTIDLGKEEEVLEEYQTVSGSKFAVGSCVIIMQKNHTLSDITITETTVNSTTNIIGVVKRVHKVKDSNETIHQFLYDIQPTTIDGAKMNGVAEYDLMLKEVCDQSAPDNLSLESKDVHSMKPITMRSEEDISIRDTKEVDLENNDQDILNVTSSSSNSGTISSQTKHRKRFKKNHYTRSTHSHANDNDFIANDSRAFSAIAHMEKILMDEPILRVPDTWFKSMLADTRRAISGRNTQKLQEIASSLSDHCLAASMTLFGY